MSESMPAKIVRLHDLGRSSHQDAVSRLVSSAAQYPIEEIVAVLDPFLLGELRTATLSPPESVEKVLYIFGGTTLASPAEFAEYSRRSRQEWFDASWAWHRYFAALGPDDIDPTQSPDPGAEDSLL